MLRAHRDSYLHELDQHTILSILLNGAWSTQQQEITSAETNDNNLLEPDPELLRVNENTSGVQAFSDIRFADHVHRILDVGGGKFDVQRQYLEKTQRIKLSTWDPYNRTEKYNQEIMTQVRNQPVDAATSMSVLNVIPECATRLAHIATVKDALRLNGKAYFKIWPGEEPFKGTYLPCSTDTYFQANAYRDRFIREIQIVFGIEQVECYSPIHNLLIATKKSNPPLSLNEISQIQELSRQDAERVHQRKIHSMQNLYAGTNIRKLFSINLMLFKSVLSQTTVPRLLTPVCTVSVSHQKSICHL